MPRAAVALASPDRRAGRTRAAAAAADGGLEQQLVRLGRPVRARRTISRRAWIAMAGVAAIAVWLTIVFGGTLSEVGQAAAKRQAIAAEAATLQARLDADHREQVLVQTDAFQRLQARAYGIGARGEVVFTLPQDAPSPPPIVPLGGVPAPAPVGDAARTPLDAWLQILFGN